MTDASGQTPLKVAIAAEQLFSPVPGGIGRYVSELLANIGPHCGAEVVAFAARGKLPLPVKAPGVRLERSMLPRSMLYESWHSARKPLAPRGMHVVHATSLAVAPPGDAALVVTVHDLAFETEPENHSRWGLRFHRRGLVLAEREASLLITPSATTGEELAELHPAMAGRIRVVPHGVQMPEADPEALARLRRRLRLEGPYVLWVGTQEPRKNLPRLIQAFAIVAKSIPGLTLALVGPVGWKERDPLAMAEQAGIGERIRVLGATPVNALGLLYAGCEVFVYPSLKEGFGFPILEAMAAGAPVVTSDTSSLPEAAGGAALLVDPARAGAIAEGIAAVIEDRALADKLREAGLDRARSMTWARAAEQTAEVYREAAK